MMKQILVSVCFLILASCTHSPKCGNPDGAKVILEGGPSCQVRIRQVTLGSELKIPASLKGPGLANFSLDWVEPTLQSGRIELGHFILVPTSQKNETSR